ncbi:hypothetical protein [Flavisolibacter nicotianae]|uniref:hypothetical protein n=1 Tax=Flavisolibacter nicotianae TaxID=2364882 RepID=UPI000EB1889E|nr:hypothetical protein [Flavisolibacter nicotianae]
MTETIAKEVIDALEKINPEAEFAYEEAVKTFLYLGRFPVFIDKVEKGTKICRSRTHYNDEQFFNKVSDVFIPPPKVVSSYARCNKPFQSKLYGSENRPTSYIELVRSWTKSFNNKEKLLVTVGQWETQRDFNLVIVTSPDANLRTSAFDKYYGSHLDDFISQSQDEERKAFVRIYRYLFCKFRNDAGDLHTYLITSAYCNLSLCLAKESADGIYYPSVIAKQDRAMNFAFNSGVANHFNFKLLTVIRNEITVEKNHLQTNFKETGINQATSFDIERDEIVW